jgi:hypothetical protein
MPVEIRELQIVAVVDKSNGKTQTPAANNAVVDTDKLIAECVEQVLEILKQKNER